MTEVGYRLPALSEAAQAVLTRLLIAGPASRADLARVLMLSAPSLTRIVRVLEDDDLVVAGDWAVTGTQRTGRPSQSVDVNVDAIHLVGVKLTDAAMTLVRTDMRSRVLGSHTTALTDTSAPAVIETIVDAVLRQVEIDPTVAGVGISLAGPISPRSDVVPISPFLKWVDVPLRRAVQQRVGLPVFVDNDVRALTATEHWFGAAAGCSDFVLVTVGAGVGCGMVVDNHLLAGTMGGVGQIGHLPVSDSGPMCENGHRGCARAYLSTTAMVRHAAIALADPTLTYQDLLELAASGHPVAGRIVDDAGHALGTIIGTLASIGAPQKVIVTGEGAGFACLVEDLINQRAREVEHWTVAHTPIHIVPFALTEWARGAAVIALRQLLAAAVGSAPFSTPASPSPPAGAGRPRAARSSGPAGLDREPA